jgi:hypothetical protein
MPSERVPSRRERDPASRAVLSAIIPGLGQFTQGRWALAGLQLATVAAYVVIAAHAADRGRALSFALLWNVWSTVDAYLYERRD